MAATGQPKATAHTWIDANRQWLSDFHQEIWAYAEPAYREYLSAQAYVALLRQQGFTVEAGSGEMPTAFCATWGRGGPVLATFAEYDAVPGNSQQAVPYQAPREGLHPWAAGHTDPHSSLGVAALMGILGAKAAMESHGLAGTLRIFGSRRKRSAAPSPSTPPRATTTILMRRWSIIPTPPTPSPGKPTAVPIGASYSPLSAWNRSGGWTPACWRPRTGRIPWPAAPALWTQCA